PLSTVSLVLKRNGIGRLGRIGLEQPRRYERTRPGELVHIDVKKLGRIQGGAGKRTRGGNRQHPNPRSTDRNGVVRRTVGWEYVHIAIDVGPPPLSRTAGGQAARRCSASFIFS